MSELIEERERRFETQQVLDSRPTFTELKPIALETIKTKKRAKVVVDVQYLMELVDFFEHGTNTSVDFHQNAPDKIKRLEEYVETLKDENVKMKEKIKDVLYENSLLLRRCEARLKIKLPTMKIYPWLNSIMVRPDNFYVILNKKGELVDKYID